jgi:predicted acyltransferase
VLLLLLAAYGAVLKWWPVPGFGPPDLDLPLRAGDGSYHAVFSNLCSWIDTRVFGVRCLHHVSDAATGALIWAFDPEGLLSTLGALATTLLGVLAGRSWWNEAGHDLAGSSRLRRWLAAGLALLLLGWLAQGWIPWNKRLWTPSYVLWSGGFAILTLAALRSLLDGGRWSWGYQPFEWYGRNAITAFFYSSLAATAMVHLSIPFGPDTGMPLQRFVYERLYASWAGPLHGSLFYAISVVVVWALICGEMHRRRQYWKI